MRYWMVAEKINLHVCMWFVCFPKTFDLLEIEMISLTHRKFFPARQKQKECLKVGSLTFSKL